ncbi:general secretion pathway protein GspF [Gammaproteobacteria bacterium 45_16_T64]|mgnify:CR=1 FL=1|nr:general secretion pathway protein GspF [Gammaproteobacteria bacterium 45_16_T64]
MKKTNQPLSPDAPLFHPDHRRPRTRREFISQGFMAGAGTVIGASTLNMFTPENVIAQLANDLEADTTGLCNIQDGTGKIPFICFDLAGGANISGSNVLIGKQGGQLDLLNTSGYSRHGLPGDRIPGLPDAINNSTDSIDQSLGLAFHSDSGFLRGINQSLTAGTADNVNGAVIPSRSDNDTGNNPHNPMYGIGVAGARGSLLANIGSRSSESGGNSMAPSKMIELAANLEVPVLRPTKIDRPSDATGLVDTGQLTELLGGDAVAVMESITRLSKAKLDGLYNYNPASRLITSESQSKVYCSYLKSAVVADDFQDGPSVLDPSQDERIVGDSGIFSQAEWDSDSEFRKTGSVMKLVIDGRAGAGTVTMGGYDYHTGERATGEIRDERAGRCMGACLEYARQAGKPLMMYVYSDGSLSSNGTIDTSDAGRNKGVWTGDNSSTGGAFFLVYNPNGKPVPRQADPNGTLQNLQIGYMDANGAVQTSSSVAANNVNLLSQTIVLNYMALHGEEGNFFDSAYFGNDSSISDLGSSAVIDDLAVFESIIT